MQQDTDYISPGPWVGGVEARAGVDTDGDGNIDQWTAWQTVSESYDHKPGYARVVDVTPAQLDLSGLPAGYGFKFEFNVDDTVVSGVKPIMDRVEFAFEPSYFQVWSNTNDTPALPQGDHNDNGVPNITEFTLGQASLPGLQTDDMSLSFLTTWKALADEYGVEIWFCENLATSAWKAAPADLTAGVTLERNELKGEGDRVMEFSLAPEIESLYWRFEVSSP